MLNQKILIGHQIGMLTHQPEAVQVIQNGDIILAAAFFTIIQQMRVVRVVYIARPEWLTAANRRIIWPDVL